MRAEIDVKITCRPVPDDSRTEEEKAMDSRVAYYALRWAAERLVETGRARMRRNRLEIVKEVRRVGRKARRRAER